ncbi:hypothetical protein GmRootV59_09680 [Variovorax sp. V59]|uniref:hypothetical protein n=1 Tax=unclassified Variovorax TaxID=663243 RepID=UPI0034E8E27E
MSSNSRNSSKNDRVAQALGIYRSIASCHERLARGDDVHALTAALMLPCYQAGFRRLASELGPAEQDELSSVLRRMERADAPALVRREAPSAVH